MNSRYIIDITNCTDSKWDIQCGYKKVIITDKDTGESVSFRCCSPIQDIVTYVAKYAEIIVKTADDFRDKLIRIHFTGKNDLVVGRE